MAFLRSLLFNNRNIEEINSLEVLSGVGRIILIWILKTGYKDVD
jgi:hypothetical protein